MMILFFFGCNFIKLDDLGVLLILSTTCAGNSHGELAETLEQTDTGEPIELFMQDFNLGCMGGLP